MDGDDGHYYSHMPDKVARWYGLGTPWSSAFPSEVINLNDNLQNDFTQIADHLEAKVQYGHTSSGKNYFRTGLE